LGGVVSGVWDDAVWVCRPEFLVVPDVVPPAVSWDARIEVATALMRFLLSSQGPGEDPVVAAIDGFHVVES
jgi:hypothetical protein